MRIREGLFLSVLLGVLIGCGGGNQISSPPPGPGPAGNAQFYATDQAGTVENLWVQIQRIELRNAQEEWITALNFEKPVELDLMQLQNFRQYLGSAQLPGGVYDRLRLIFGTSNRVAELGNSRDVAFDSSTVERVINAIVGSSGVTEFTIDIEAGNGLREDSLGNFSFSTSAVDLLVNHQQPGIPVVPDPARPERRPVILTGVVTAVHPEDQSFRLRLKEPMHREEVWIFTGELTRYFPPDKSFSDIQEGTWLDVVGVPENRGERKGFLALDIFFLEKEGDQVTGVILEIFYDLRMIRLGVKDGWRDHCRDPRMSNAPGLPPIPCPPMHFIWVYVNDDAVIETEDGRRLEFTDLHPGMVITAFGSWRAFDLFQAHRILVRGELPPPPPMEIVGRLAEKKCEEGILIVAAPGREGHDERLWKVILTEHTRIVDEHGNPISCTDLNEGDILKILGHPKEGEEHTLVDLKRLPEEPPPPPPLFHIIGKLAEKNCEDGILIVVAPGREGLEVRWKVILTEETKILDENDNPITCGDLNVGDILLVGGKLKEGEEHTIIAFLVKRLPEEPPHR